MAKKQEQIKAESEHEDFGDWMSRLPHDKLTASLYHLVLPGKHPSCIPQDIDILHTHLSQIKSSFYSLF